ncbi:Peptidoglycan recognition protein 4 [Araneus ventricosus]|uniref:Peptidoglycan recognition protein 4 n=1 Tax=Araneus ventricosus TaxID=182803 RepID=A0A4Y2UJL8_ARAVE|nr:Peptidoglycan recognition protein 4 [Araneus ventricosus]
MPAPIISSGLVGCNPFDVILPLVCRARTVGGGREFNRKPDHVILSHTLEKTCSRLHECCRIVQELQNYHMHELNWPDIGYNFLIGDDGRVYVGRGWNRIGQFSHEFNEKSLSIAFIGNFFNISPGPMALSAAKNLIACAIIKVSIKFWTKSVNGKSVCLYVRGHANAIPQKLEKRDG